MKKKVSILLIMISCLIVYSIAVLAAPAGTAAPSGTPAATPASSGNSASSGTVDIYPNLAKVVIDGEKANVQTVLFQDKVYIAVRDLSKILGVNVSYDSNSTTVSLTGVSKLTESSPDILKSFLYIIARALQFAGLVLIFQVAFFRSKKDFYFVRKYNSSQTSLRRLAHTAGTTRMGAYYVLIGTVITLFVTGKGLPFKVSIPFIIILSLIFWFLGLGAANSTTKQSNILEDESDNNFEA